MKEQARRGGRRGREKERKQMRERERKKADEGEVVPGPLFCCVCAAV